MMMRIPIYSRMIDDALANPGEGDRLQWLTEPPAVGDWVSLGEHRLWAVVELHPFRGDGPGKNAYVAYCHPVGLEVPDRSTWLDWEIFERDRQAKTLSLYLNDGQVIHWEHSFRAGKPRIGEVLQRFDLDTRKPAPQPWAAETYATYSPVVTGATPFTALYFADLKPVVLTEVEGAIALEPEQAPEMAVAQ